MRFIHPAFKILHIKGILNMRYVSVLVYSLPPFPIAGKFVFVSLWAGRFRQITKFSERQIRTGIPCNIPKNGGNRIQFEAASVVGSSILFAVVSVKYVNNES